MLFTTPQPMQMQLWPIYVRPKYRKVPSVATPARRKHQPLQRRRPFASRDFGPSLFGGEDEHDAAVYDRSLDAGSSVVVVKGTPGHDVEAVMAILERHSPIDIDERGAGYGLSSTTRTSASTA